MQSVKSMMQKGRREYKALKEEAKKLLADDMIDAEKLGKNILQIRKRLYKKNGYLCHLRTEITEKDLVGHLTAKLGMARSKNAKCNALEALQEFVA